MIDPLHKKKNWHNWNYNVFVNSVEFFSVR